MYKTISRITLLIALIMIPAMISAATADEVLAKASQKINSSKSLTVKFTGSASGTLTVSGRMFAMVAGGLGIWYNGTDMWTYSKKAGETSLTTPTQAEVMETNPMEIIKNYRSMYTAKKVSETGNKCTITLIPKAKNSSVRMATIVVNTSTWYPESIDLIMSNDSRMTLNVTSVTQGQSLPPSHFDYPQSKYPGVEVVDLR